jgi:hypothetical protein
MVTSDKIDQILPSIHKVQQAAGTIQKNTKGQVGTRNYNYANLNDTWDAIKELLNTNGLTVVQSPTSGQQNMGHHFQTTIFHESGQWVQETMQMVLQRDDPQSIGAAITYYRRYMLTSMLGLIPDDDNDARDQRLATAAQKAKIVGAVKLLYPELTKPEDIIQTIQNIVGKYPGNIRESEADDAVSTIKAFSAKPFGGDDNESTT